MSGEPTAEVVIYHALRVYGAADSDALRRRLATIAENDRRTPVFAASAISEAVDRLVSAGDVHLVRGQYRVDVASDVPRHLLWPLEAGRG